MSEPILMPLKAKYRQPGRLMHRQWDPPSGTWTFACGTHASKKGGNSGGGKIHAAQTLRPRMRAYWGNVVRS